MRDAHTVDRSVDDADALATTGHCRDRLAQRDALDRSLTCHAIRKSKWFAPRHLGRDGHHLRAEHKIRPRMHAIQVKQTGGREALQYVEMEKPKPKNGEVLVRLESIGVNFIDVYHRTGLYKLPLPLTPGSEGAGVVEEVGGDVREFKKGDRVAWAMSPGAYAEYAALTASKLVPIPNGVDFKTAAAAMLQGMAAHYLAVSTYPLKSGDTGLVHAAAGGVGGLLVQVAKMRGARVFGTVSTSKKASVAREAGADEVINYKESDFEAETLRLTN